MASSTVSIRMGDIDEATIEAIKDSLDLPLAEAGFNPEYVEIRTAELDFTKHHRRWSLEVETLD